MKTSALPCVLDGSAPPASHVDVLGVRIQRVTSEEALAALLAMMADDTAHSVYLVNAATANLAYPDPEYRACLNRGHLVLNDGTGVRCAARWQGVRLDANHVGTDLMPRLCSAGASWGARVFLLGGGPGVAARAAETLTARCPGIHIAGHHHGYVTEADDVRISGIINAARPDLLLVAMGNPLQELWIDRNLPRLRRGVAVGVGGLFDHLAGHLRRAPLWVRQAGLEWLQLLGQQPHKWRRYILGNPLFVYRMTLGRPRGRARGTSAVR